MVGVDASPRMIELAKARVGSGALFHCADLEGDLDFLEDGFFDIALAPLVMDCIADWRPVFGRFHQALKPQGLLVFSFGNPCFDALYFRTARYFETERVSCVWRGFGTIVEMPSYRRSLGEAINSVLESGFELVRIVEPQPTEDFRRADPERYEQLLRQPCFLCIKARKRSAS